MTPSIQKETFVVPKKYSGQWIAWNRDKTVIVASGRTADEAEDRALEKGEESPVLAKVPLADVRFLGGLQ
jgi:hypothetical protein